VGRWGRFYTLVAIVAVVAQFLVLGATFFMGLGWGGPTWLAGLAQAAVGIVVVGLLGTRRSWWVVAVPVVSALLTVGLVTAAERLEAGSACSEQERAAFAQFSQPGDLEMELEGSMSNGCTAHGYTDTAPADVVAHFAEELSENGWDIQDRQSNSIIAERDSLMITVETAPQEGGMIIVSVWNPSEQ
jgi:hypothetical protein